MIEFIARAVDSSLLIKILLRQSRVLIATFSKAAG